MTENLICRNPACPWANRERIVSYPQIGPGLFLRAPVRCECGTAAEVLPESVLR